MSLEHRPHLLQRAEPRICAFDIETTKLPLQFPNADYDQVGQFASAALGYIQAASATWFMAYQKAAIQTLDNITFHY